VSGTASEIAEKIGHIMNYGDGVYGGIFVAALYAEAFFETDLNLIIEKALLSLPSASDYYKIVKDVIKLHNQYPADWEASWKELEAKWGDVDICGAGSPFNIDAKLNGASMGKVIRLKHSKYQPVAGRIPIAILQMHLLYWE
jgi:hypothetical protein